MDKKLKACNIMLESMIGKDNIDIWWNSPNKAFDMKMPIDVYKETPDVVINYLLRFTFK